MPEPEACTRSFPPEARLRTSGEFRRVQADGRFHDLGAVVVRVAPRPAVDGHVPRGRLGLSVSRRVGDAVRRNRVKRRLRELFRARQARFEGWDVVVSARPAAATASFDALGRALDALADRLSRSGQGG